MTKLRDSRIEVLDEHTLAAARRQTPADSLAAGHAMWAYARDRMRSAVRWLHPDWSDAQVSREVSRRLLDESRTALVPARRDA